MTYLIDYFFEDGTQYSVKEELSVPIVESYTKNPWLRYGMTEEIEELLTKRHGKISACCVNRIR